MSDEVNNFDEMENLDWVNEEHGISFLPPTIQWRRGDLVNQDQRLKKGCWQFPTEGFAAFADLLGSESVEVLHGGGVVVDSFLLEKIHICVLAYRKRWFVLGGDGKPAYLSGHFDQFPSVRSKLQVWCLVKELGNEPCIVSVAGMNSKHLEDALKEFSGKIIQMSRSLKKRFGRHHFWLPLSSQGKIATKQNQYITPPGSSLTEEAFETQEATLATMRRLFVGREVAELAEAMIPEAAEWARQQVTAPAPEPVYQQQPVPEAPPLQENEVPF